MAKSRIFFISDIHGSTRCFRKFLNGAKFYSANVIILGGDIAGKVITPIVEESAGAYSCTFQGQELRLNSKEELDALTKRAADSGSYTRVVSRPEFEELEASPQRVTDLFKQLMLERVREWTALAEERLGKTSVQCFISPGNDDIFEIDETLNSSSYVVNPEGRVVEVDGGHEMITLGYTNHTPWNSPREVDEGILAGMIGKMADQVKNTESAIFNLHVPPINTILDQAPRVDETLKVVVRGGNIEMISAGSTACRGALEKYQPMLGLHGHIHESKGVVTIGKTLCVNPGSEYGEGVLLGTIVDVEKEKVKFYLLTTG